MSFHEIRWPRWWVVWAVFWLLAWLGFLAFASHISSTTWARIIPGFDVGEAEFGPSSEGAIRLDLILWLGLITAISAGAVVVMQYYQRLQNPSIQARLISVIAPCCVFFCLVYCEYWYNENSPWYVVQTMMTNPTSVPIFGQRLLFIWPAMLLHHLVPGASLFLSFLAFQYVALALAIYLVGAWSQLFIGSQLKVVGLFILGVALAPTFRYFNGHDFGVVACYTACFLLLYKKHYWLYGLAFSISMLNHQNILLLIPTALAIMWRREKWSTTILVASLTTAAYFVLRLVLNTTLPIPQSHEIKVWYNIRQVVELKKGLVLGELALMPWYAFTLVGWGGADPFLKRASILLPMQYGVFFLFGQYNEVRIFNGFIPVLIGIWLCYIRQCLDSAKPIPSARVTSSSAAKLSAPTDTR